MYTTCDHPSTTSMRRVGHHVECLSCCRRGRRRRALLPSDSRAVCTTAERLLRCMCECGSLPPYLAPPNSPPPQHIGAFARATPSPPPPPPNPRRPPVTAARCTLAPRLRASPSRLRRA